MVLQAGAGKQGEKKGAAEPKCYGLTAAPGPHPPVLVMVGGN